ncbi:MAG TPA: hypothetical protein VKA63_06095 [Candidatus Krumholzibacteria bacterium]|nr:hypothetical protein [Candidatus Krumholzibacteria bacterium]
MKDQQAASPSPKRRIYKAPEVKKQQGLKELMVRTHFNRQG